MSEATKERSKEDILTEQIQTLEKTIKEFVEKSPDFPEGLGLARKIGVALAHVETTLHWKFNCWELGLPHQ